MINKTEIQEQIVLQSLVESDNLIQSTRNHMEKLSVMSQLIKNVLLIGKKYDGTKKIPLLFKNNIIIEENGKIYMDPLTPDEKASYFSGNFSILLYSDKQSEKQSDVESRIELINEIMEKKKYFQEIIPTFLSYLFPHSTIYKLNPDDKVNDDLLLDLYIMLAEEYKNMLEERDIGNMAILGSKTIELIINTIYKNINEHKKLQKIDKGIIMIYIKKFFFTISNTVDYLSPV